MSSTVDDVAAAIGRGEAAIVPTDTVYGLACTPHEDEAVRRMYRLKGREDEQPTALVAADLDVLLECIPELAGRAETIARALLPGGYTLVLPNPAGRFRRLTGPRATAIGVRVPALAGAARELLDRVGALAATSANLPGGPDPRTLADVPQRLRDAVGAALDGGELPGTASTVLDCTGPEPIVLRAGASPVDEAVRRLRAALG